jgi:hypothetical protein
MMRKINLTLIGVLASLQWAGAVYARPPMHLITKTLSFAMPACPIEATTVPPTKTEFRVTRPRGPAVSVAGTVQVADQSGGVILKISADEEADRTGITFSRTVNTIQHITGSVDFDHGCTATDPYGSNRCTWIWGDSITADYQGALQEDITAGKLVVDLKINNTIPFAFSCPVCGATCTITIPKQIDQASWDEIWDLMFRLILFPNALPNR